MRKKIGWRARALYITIALALLIGLLPLAVPAAAGHAEIVVVGPKYAKIGDLVCFTAFFNPAPDTCTFTFEGGNPPQVGPVPGPGSTYTTCSTFLGEAGMREVTVTANWGALVQTETIQIMIGSGLLPQISWNVLGTQETFCVPAPGYAGRVTNWMPIGTLGLGGPGDGWNWVGGDPNVGPLPRPDCVTVMGIPSGPEDFGGELHLYAETNADLDGIPGNDTLHGVKKWGKINVTDVFERSWLGPEDFDLNWLSETNCETCEIEIGSGSTQVIWHEEMKEFEAYVELVELVWGTFPIDPGYMEAPANGALVTWWVMSANAPVHDLPCNVSFAEIDMALDEMQADFPAAHTTFAGDGTKITTTSGDDQILGDGFTSVTLNAEGEEAVAVVIVAHYPGISPEEPEWAVCPEVVKWNFWTQQLEKVPQVRWAGEKICLEKQFGSSFAGYPVRFSLENQSPGCLEGVEGTPNSGCQEQWTMVDPDGVARCILVSEAPGEVDVDVALYEPDIPTPILMNQHGFVVFYLKFEELVLSNVEGERVDNPLTYMTEGHNSGIWDPENPWDPTLDTDFDTLNVSQDDLLRARVKGWFMGDNLSWRAASYVDLNHNGVFDEGDYYLPAGRWVLPDDWQYLAGPMWQQFRPHWDIMTQPNDDVMSWVDGRSEILLFDLIIIEQADKAEEMGPYMTWMEVLGISFPLDLVAAAPVVGPYSSLDDYTPFVNPVLNRKTIVRNAKLNWWDCPMPPAKIIFAIEEGSGFFKETDKGDIYYHLESMDGSIGLGELSIIYTNPFYLTMIPACEAIPPFINNGGYDWDSWSLAYGPYDFWEIFNQIPGITPDDPQHPTMVEVYSDNHGEAMVYLNGDWNLDLSMWLTNGAYDVPPGTIVGRSDVVAFADYPYLRKHPVITSGNVSKEWEWGKEILGADPAEYNDGSVDDDVRMVFQTGTFTSIDDGGDGLSDKKMVFIWVCDRDGFPNVGERIDWYVEPTADCAPRIAVNITGCTLSQYMPEDICVNNGFLRYTGGVIDDPVGYTGHSYTIMPDPDSDDPGYAAQSADLLDLFDKFWGIENWHHAVAAVEFISSGLDCTADVHIILHEEEGDIIRHVNLDWAEADDPDDPIVRGDADHNGEINMGDVTCVERQILGLNVRTYGADANNNGTEDMGDVTKIERTILGL